MRVLNRCMCVLNVTVALKFPASRINRKYVPHQNNCDRKLCAVIRPNMRSSHNQISTFITTPPRCTVYSRPAPAAPSYTNRIAGSTSLSVLLPRSVLILAVKGLQRSLFFLTNSAVEINYHNARTDVYTYCCVELSVNFA